MSRHRQIEEALSAWGDCQVLTALRGGNRNTVLLVEHRGERAVAKSSRRSAEAIAWLEPVHVKARAAGFAVPHFIPSDTGALLVDGVTLETWIEGVPPSTSDLVALEHLFDSFHSLTRSWVQRPGCKSTSEFIDHDRGGDVDLSVMPPALVEACRSAWRALAGEPDSAVHGDVNLANLLVTPAGHIALLDWDECRADVSALDAVVVAGLTSGRAAAADSRVLKASLAWEVAVSWREEPRYARRMVRELLAL